MELRIQDHNRKPEVIFTKSILFTFHVYKLTILLKFRNHSYLINELIKTGSVNC